MSKAVKKYNENVLNLKVGNNHYAIHRRNIAGIVYFQMVDKSYTLWFHLIHPLNYDRHNPEIWSVTLPNATYKDYLGLLHWFDNPCDLLEEGIL